jgi:cytochrome c oxidase cbb3-type subunit 3
MRRCLILISLVAMVILLLAACGRSQPAAQPASAGPEPDFSSDTPYVSVDELKQAYDQGANMVILDARPAQDYQMDHISGAISMPFYEVEDRHSELPRDTWIVTYCACPRAEAEEAARILRDNGFTKVKVLYDGYFEWLGRDYPVTQGSAS